MKFYPLQTQAITCYYFAFPSSLIRGYTFSTTVTGRKDRSSSIPAFTPQASTRNIADSARTSNIADSARTRDIADSARTRNIADSARTSNIADSARNIADSARTLNIADSARNIADSARNIADSARTLNIADSARNIADSARNIAPSSPDCHSSLPPVNFATREFNKKLSTISQSKVKGSAKKAERLLLDALSALHINNHDDTDDPSSVVLVRPNVVSFTTVMNAWSRSFEGGSVDRVLALLIKLELLYEEKKEQTMRPNKFTYGAVINTLARSNDPESASLAEEYLGIMLEKCNKGDKGCCPDSNTYGKVINAWSRRNTPEAPEKAYTLLKEMKEPDTVAYTSVIQAFAGSARDDAAEKASSLLDEMHNLVAEGHAKVSPNSRTVNFVLQAFAKKAKTDSSFVTKSEKLLRSMEMQYNAGYDEIRPTTGSYNLVLKAISNASVNRASRALAQQADTVLNRMNVLFEASGCAYVMPNKISYGHVIRAWAKVAEGGPDRSLRVLKKMLARYDAGDDGCCPSTYLYNVVLDGFANGSRQKKGYGRKAEDLLQSMEERFENGDSNVKPTRVTYNIVLSALSRSGEKWAAERADKIVSRMEALYESGDEEVRPDAVSYSSVIRAYAASRKRGNSSIRRAEEILQRQIDVFKAGYQEAKPNFIVFSVVINSLGKKFSKDSASRACNLLLEMRKLQAYVGGQDTDLIADTPMYNSVLKILSRDQAPASAVLAKELVGQMEQNPAIRPNLTTYNTLIYALANSRGRDTCGEEAIEILNKLQTLYEKGDRAMKPDVITYNSVIRALAKSYNKEAAAKAEVYLENMKEMYEAGQSEFAPNSRTFSSCINAWANSNDSNAGEQAEKLLALQWNMYEEMDGAPLEFKPDFISYTATMKAWVRSGHKSTAVRVENLLHDMLSRYENGDKSLRPSRQTYDIVRQAFASDEETLLVRLEEIRQRVLQCDSLI